MLTPAVSISAIATGAAYSCATAPEVWYSPIPAPRRAAGTDAPTTASSAVVNIPIVRPWSSRNTVIGHGPRSSA